MLFFLLSFNRSQFASTLWPRTIDSLRALATLPAATAARVPPKTA